MGNMLLMATIIISAIISSCGLEAERQSQSDLQSTRSNKILCIFDYDLTLSSNKCGATQGRSEFNCRYNKNPTYNWYDQCLGLSARQAVAKCVYNNAHIGIASHSPLGASWEDKVLPMVYESQFPEWTYSGAYPQVDNWGNWNCPTCPYHMNPGISKPEGIRRIMRHYGLNPYDPADQARVIFWDDSWTNINAVRQELPSVQDIKVPRNQSSGNDGGCGITDREISQGWQAVGGW
ncbi:hypothetical protein [Pseudobacteriovorax antillogorgiicola]|uniref:Uncharacterized protein n=1 Tax=Pseudobacteriovorax antillogorgiicola TaxID=1513793 RepID=A0A1Y6C4B8_9BACT|nr:hypothetical protein [Pseudobacteriovorax antillogorgiicola]TCS49827.1 hypothetical protein EDD56_11472 [Pseudobacteriovorax antillogorgiicola]SMF43345.1 hypothetical protein SAMN06296036_11371 [Pseudobacteriovorax antillogorgiicola]